MEDKRIYTIAIVFGVIAIVLSLLAGALSGAVTGYLWLDGRGGISPSN